MIDKFLVEKYGTKVFKYKGFMYIKDIINTNNEYIINTYQTYKNIAKERNENVNNVERSIRYFKINVESKKMTNTEFINNLILEYKEWKSL